MRDGATDTFSITRVTNIIDVVFDWRKRRKVFEVKCLRNVRVKKDGVNANLS